MHAHVKRTFAEDQIQMNDKMCSNTGIITDLQADLGYFKLAVGPRIDDFLMPPFIH